jgi:hypothetical protein
MEPRRISSRFTALIKFVVPGIFLLAILDLLLWPDESYVLFSDDVPLELVWLVPIAGFVITLLYARRLKAVSMDDKYLYISNYRREITIPLRHIGSVREFLLSEPRRITIHSRHRTEFGKKIVFLAKFRLADLWSRHTIVNELMQFAPSQNTKAEQSS